MLTDTFVFRQNIWTLSRRTLLFLGEKTETFKLWIIPNTTMLPLAHPRQRMSMWMSHCTSTPLPTRWGTPSTWRTPYCLCRRRPRKRSTTLTTGTTACPLGAPCSTQTTCRSTAQNIFINKMDGSGRSWQRIPNTSLSSHWSQALCCLLHPTDTGILWCKLNSGFKVERHARSNFPATSLSLTVSLLLRRPVVLKLPRGSCRDAMIVMCLSNLNISRKDWKRKTGKTTLFLHFSAWVGQATEPAKARQYCLLSNKFLNFFFFQISFYFFFFKCGVLKDPRYLFLSTGTDVYSFSVPESPNNLYIRISKREPFL